jgi:UDP-N-acetylglucosamine 4,6-dehydratase
LAYEEALKDKTILVTGGTGSFGKKFVELVLTHNPKAVRVLSRNEYFQWQMKQGLSDVRFFIGDIRDRDRIYRASKGCDIIIHAAALKHVSFCEYNPIEAVRTNILGSINIVDCGIDNGVEKVLGISSDKAVDPINLYGATKLVMEKLLIDANVYGGKFSVVRFGNLIGSRGSFFDLLNQKKSDIIPITDTRMTRYWIGMEDAVKFSFKCLDMMEGGEIFIPKMAKIPVNDLVSVLAPDAKKEIIGQQAGEKLSEALIGQGEVGKAEDCESYWVIK